ncbi:Cell division control protein 24 [Cyberlindnera fabianii]|uniref:Cell division control protein 24 n=1 Tax=Cyberlindnera fabianii TaxID=36022 RepID=A0A1V2L4Q9_CYBFA|nr:Cell division control protein 24 [Cyberlindnera fabianii]
MSRNGSSSGLSMKTGTNTPIVSLPSGAASRSASINGSNINVASFANNNTLMLMNKQVTSNDSLYYVCLKLKKRLESAPQLKPYLNLAYSSAEVLSENQALALSQKSSHSSNSQSGYGPSNSSNMRMSGISNFSNVSDDSGNLSSNAASPAPAPLTTFHAGVLPATVSCDPVTQLWALFQQGSPLCVIFNLIKPTQTLPVVSSDDLKTCKKSIYDFILACKNYLSFEHADLFTISNVFSNETDDLIRIIKVINRVINLAPAIFKPQEIEEEIKITDSKSKVIKELVETERKYVNDLETLLKYKEQLLEFNIISSEDLYMLFPNLDDIVDFQRRVLISLEINSLVESRYQRIGSIFIHAQSFFKLYEPWSIGQKAAIDFISSSPLKQQNSKLIIENDFELQSFLLKPVQRLCKYPLLLKELLKYTEPASPNYNELLLSLDISKKIANDINENQRRVENVEVLKKLFDKVVDWKGYDVHSFGELLFFDKVVVNDNSKNSDEREFQVYLFENIIIFFKELLPQQKKNSIGLKKKSTTNLLASGEVLGYELKGRISIANIYNINSVNPHQLNISWSGIKDTGSFLMRFKNEETRTNWESCIRKLVTNLQEEYQTRNVQSMSQMNLIDRRSNGISIAGSSRRSSYIGRNSDASTTYSGTTPGHSRQRSEVPLSSRTTQDSIQTKRSISESYKNSLPANSIIVRLMYEQDLFTMMVSLEIGVAEFLEKIDRKIKQCGGQMKGKVKYQDEDGDFIVIGSEDDWSMVKDMMQDVGDKVLHVWVT